MSGQKNVTWRFFDEKDIKAGDPLSLINKATGEQFVEATVESVTRKPFKDISDEDITGHEFFASREEMLQTYQGYYGDSLFEGSEVKIIGFKLLTSLFMFFETVSGKRIEKPDSEIVHERVSGYAAIINDQNQLLMINANWNDKWHLPGGGISIGESIPEGIIRECMEEVGYRVKLDSEVRYTNVTYYYDDVLEHTFNQSFNHFYIAKIKEKENKVGGEEGEVKDVKWVDLDSLSKENCRDFLLDFIEMLQNKGL